MFLIIATFRIKWFCNNCLLSKISTVGEATFILIIFPEGSVVIMNLISFKWFKKFWIIQMVRQLCIYGFLNQPYVGSFIFNTYCLENRYKWMTMWATYFLKLNTNSIIFCFRQWTIKYNFFENYFYFLLKKSSHKYLVII